MPLILRNPKIHKNPQHSPIQSEMNPVQALLSSSFKPHFNSLPSMSKFYKWSFSFKLPHQNFVCTYPPWVLRSLPPPISSSLVGVQSSWPCPSREEQLRWSRGSVLAFGTQVRGLTPGEKFLSTPFFGWEVKPSVPCRSFTACKRSLNGEEVVISAKLPDRWNV